jgi:hypothetical protein
MTGDQLDAPNQQVVRADGSAPWDEGKGAGKAPKSSKRPDPEPETKPAGGKDKPKDD